MEITTKRYVDEVVGWVSESVTPCSVRIETDAFREDSRGHVPTVYVNKDAAKQFGLKPANKVYITLTDEDLAEVRKEPGGPFIVGHVASQYGTMLHSVPRLKSGTK